MLLKMVNSDRFGHGFSYALLNRTGRWTCIGLQFIFLMMFYCATLMDYNLPLFLLFPVVLISIGLTLELEFVCKGRYINAHIVLAGFRVINLKRWHLCGDIDFAEFRLVPMPYSPSYYYFQVKVTDAEFYTLCTEAVPQSMVDDVSELIDGMLFERYKEQDTYCLNS